MQEDTDFGSLTTPTASEDVSLSLQQGQGKSLPHVNHNHSHHSQPAASPRQPGTQNISSHP